MIYFVNYPKQTYTLSKNTDCYTNGTSRQFPDATPLPRTSFDLFADPKFNLYRNPFFLIYFFYLLFLAHFAEAYSVVAF